MSTPTPKPLPVLDTTPDHATHIEMRRLQLELERCRVRSQDLYDYAPVGYVAVDREARILDCNFLFFGMLGYNRRHLIRERLARFVDHADRERLDRYLTHAYTNGHDEPRTFRMRRNDGREIAVEFQSTVVCDRDDAFAYLRIAVLDVSARHRAEDLATRLQSWASAFLGAVDLAVVDVDQEERIEAVNGAAERLFGVQEQEALGQHIGTLLPDLSAHAGNGHTNARRLFTQSAHAYELQAERKRGDGESVALNVRVVPWWDRGERKVIVLARAAGDARDTSGRETEGTAAALAHEFRNVLHGIAGCTNVALAQPDLPEGARGHLAKIADATRRGTELADRMMKANLPIPVAFDRLVESTSSLVRGLVGEGVTVVTELNAGEAQILADPVRIEQLLLNLAANAGDAMPDGGTLTIATAATEVAEPTANELGLHAPGTYVRLDVHDDGVGMDEATRLRIFEPHFTTKQSLGLGMSIVASICAEGGVVVGVESAPGRGSTFTLWFPVYKADADEVPLERSPIHVQTTPIAHGTVAASPGRLRVLLVEPGAFLRERMQDVLATAGFDVFASAATTEAIAFARRHRIDLLLTGADVSEVEAKSLAQRVTRQWPHAAVVSMSRTHVLVRPFRPDELLRTIGRVLSAATRPRA